MVSKELTRGWAEAGREYFGAFPGVVPGRLAEPNPEPRDSGFDAAHRPGMTVGEEGPYFAFSIFVTVYPDAASSASKVTLSPTFTCLSMAGSLTR